MQRRRLLGAVASFSFVAGCSQVLSSGNGVLADRDVPERDKLLQRSRPPAERPADAGEETVESLQYPAKPMTFSDETVKTFVETHERAYRRNNLLDKYGGDLVYHNVDFSWTVTIDTSGHAGVGRCQYTFTTRIEDGDDYIVGDSATNLVTYYVDEEMIVRARDTGATDHRQRLAPDPWKTGVVLDGRE